eukprot:1014111_1
MEEVSSRNMTRYGFLLGTSDPTADKDDVGQQIDEDVDCRLSMLMHNDTIQVDWVSRNHRDEIIINKRMNYDEIIMGNTLWNFLPTFIAFRLGGLISKQCFHGPNECVYVFSADTYVSFRASFQDRSNTLSALSLFNNAKANNNEFVYESHPIHTLSLSLTEGSKQVISTMGSATNISMGTVQHTPFEYDVMYLLHRTVTEEDDDLKLKGTAEKDNEMCNPRMCTILKQSTHDLDAHKLLFNREDIEAPMAYSTLNQHHLNMFHKSNKLFVIRTTERRKPIAVDDAKEDTDNWGTFEVDDDNKDTRAQDIDIPSIFTFESVTECSISVHPRTVKIGDLMTKYCDRDVVDGVCMMFVRVMQKNITHPIDIYHNAYGAGDKLYISWMHHNVQRVYANKENEESY